MKLFFHDFLIAFVLTLLIGGMLLSAAFFLANPQPAMEAKKPQPGALKSCNVKGQMNVKKTMQAMQVRFRFVL
jgi:hypothetical protein